MLELIKKISDAVFSVQKFCIAKVATNLGKRKIPILLPLQYFKKRTTGSYILSAIFSLDKGDPNIILAQMEDYRQNEG